MLFRLGLPGTDDTLTHVDKSPFFGGGTQAVAGEPFVKLCKKVAAPFWTLTFAVPRLLGKKRASLSLPQPLMKGISVSMHKKKLWFCMRAAAGFSGRKRTCVAAPRKQGSQTFAHIKSKACLSQGLEICSCGNVASLCRVTQRKLANAICAI